MSKSSKSPTNSRKKYSQRYSRLYAPIHTVKVFKEADQIVPKFKGREITQKTHKNMTKNVKQKMSKFKLNFPMKKLPDEL